MFIGQEIKVIKYRNYRMTNRVAKNGDQWGKEDNAKWAQVSCIIIVCSKMMYKVDKNQEIKVGLLFRDIKENIIGTKSKKD